MAIRTGFLRRLEADAAIRTRVFWRTLNRRVELKRRRELNRRIELNPRSGRKLKLYKIYKI